MHIYAYAYSSTYTYPFTVMLTYIQTQRGRNDVKVCCDVITIEEQEAFLAENRDWVSKNSVQTEKRIHDFGKFEETGYSADFVVGKMSFVHEDGNSYLINEGLTTDNMPKPPKPTTYKTGEIKLEWSEDEFV